mmetsp:Transcript_60965/g.108342  ORF Transcript_60965/g.108342 Transcript_60965/m.108342 type:complete len:331 (-) Transcript_60965:35-1027(-)
MPRTPQVLASDAALKLGCSLSPELSQLLSTSGGALQLQLDADGNVETGHHKGSQSQRHHRLVSYIPGDIASPAGSRPQSPAAKSHVKEANSRSISTLSIPEPLIIPTLNFDPKQVTEYAVGPTKVEQGAVWIDGECSPYAKMAWGTRAISSTKGPRWKQDAGDGGPSPSEDSDTDLVVRVHTLRDEDLLEPSQGLSTSSVRSSPRACRPSSAGLGGRRPLGATHRPTSARQLQATLGSSGSRMRSGQWSPESGPTDSGPHLTKVRSMRWETASHSMKRQLLRGSPPPGQVSNLIHEVQRRTGRSASSRGRVVHGMRPSRSHNSWSQSSRA